jgi:hypothetical protein
MQQLESWNEACSLMCDLYDESGYELSGNCEGNLAERYMSGWRNADTMISDGQLDDMDWPNVRNYLLFEVFNLIGKF